MDRAYTDTFNILVYVHVYMGQVKKVHLSWYQPGYLVLLSNDCEPR